MSKLVKSADIERLSYSNTNFAENERFAKLIYLMTAKTTMSVDSEEIDLESTPIDVILTSSLIDGSALDDDYEIYNNTFYTPLGLTIEVNSSTVTAGLITIVGLDKNGEEISEEFDLSEGLEFNTENLYSQINDIIVEDLENSDSEDTLDIYTNDMGVTGKFRIKKNSAILDMKGEFVGNYLDSSLVINHSGLTEEVKYIPDTEEYVLRNLEVGQYSVDYYTGVIYYKLNISDEEHNSEIQYKYWILDTGTSIVNVDNLEVNSFINEDSEELQAKVNTNSVLYTTQGSANPIYASYEGDLVETSAEEVLIEFYDDMSSVANAGYISNDGEGDLEISFSYNEEDFGDSITLKSKEIFTLENMGIRTVRLTRVEDTSYRVFLRG